MKTYSAKPSDISRSWYVVDASELPLGRLATEVARLLMGKSKPMYAHHIDTGDNVIIINSDRLVVTGKKLEDKKYYKHSHYPGGLTESNMKFELEKDSTKVVYSAVRGMLPVNKLRDERLKRLKIYKSAEHNHSAQQPTTLSLTKKGNK